MKKFTLTLASVAALSLAACAGEAADETTADETAVAEEATAAGTIVDVAAGDETFSTLVAAVTAAELGEVLSGEGPFTVFAPTNDAFAKLPEGTVEKLTTEDTETLGAILTYHVVPAKVMSSEIAGKKAKVQTVNGAKASVDATNGVVIEGAKVVSADIVASNGVIHVIDKVMIPGS